MKVFDYKLFLGLFQSPGGKWYSDDEESFSVEEINHYTSTTGMLAYERIYKKKKLTSFIVSQKIKEK